MDFEIYLGILIVGVQIQKLRNSRNWTAVTELIEFHRQCKLTASGEQRTNLHDSVPVSIIIKV